jgi:hypothetical protein
MKGFDGIHKGKFNSLCRSHIVNTFEDELIVNSRLRRGIWYLIP